jgi:hypothetical protein
VSGPDDPVAGADWQAFRAARERFFSAVRPEAMDEPAAAGCPDAPPADWARHVAGGGPDRPDRPTGAA